MVERQWRFGSGTAGGIRHVSIVGGHRLALAGTKLSRDPAHLRVLSPAIGISDKLAAEIASIEPRQSRRARTVAAPVEAVAGEASISCTGRSPAERDETPIGSEAISGGGFDCRASSQQAAAGGKHKDGATGHRLLGTRRSPPRFLSWLPVLMLVLACKPPPDQRHLMPVADAAAGKAAIERVGCGSCHTISGIHWPQGRVGPRLDGLAERGLIAGQLPNRPDILAAYLRNAPALVPGSGMPAMPLSAAEARDIVAYLYEQGTH